MTGPREGPFEPRPRGGSARLAPGARTVCGGHGFRPAGSASAGLWVCSSVCLGFQVHPGRAGPWWRPPLRVVPASSRCVCSAALPAGAGHPESPARPCLGSFQAVLGHVALQVTPAPAVTVGGSGRRSRHWLPAPPPRASRGPNGSRGRALSRGRRGSPQPRPEVRKALFWQTVATLARSSLFHCS